MLQLAVRLLLAERLEYLQRTADADAAVRDANGQAPGNEVQGAGASVACAAFLQPLPAAWEDFCRQTLCVAYVQADLPTQRTPDTDEAREIVATRSRRLLIRRPDVLQRLQCDAAEDLAATMRQWAQSLVGKVEAHWRPVRAMLLSSMLDTRRSECVFQQAPRSGLRSVTNRHVLLASVRALAEHGREHVLREAWQLHALPTGSGRAAAGASAAGAATAVGPGTFDPLLRDRGASLQPQVLLHDDPAFTAQMALRGAGVEVQEALWFGQEMQDVLTGVVMACAADRSTRQRA